MDELETLYQLGYNAGLTGIRQRCPETIYNDEDHARRDAWIDGYKTGEREYKRQKWGYHLGDIHISDAAKGPLFVGERDAQGNMPIRDCEGGTILVILQVDPEPCVIIPEAVMTPEMAYIAGRAIQKAAGMAYRIEQDRAIHPASRQDMIVPPARPVQPPPEVDYTGAELLLSLHDTARIVQRAFKRLYWHARKGQETEPLENDLRDGVERLNADYSRYLGDPSK